MHRRYFHRWHIEQSQLCPAKPQLPKPILKPPMKKGIAEVDDGFFPDKRRKEKHNAEKSSRQQLIDLYLQTAMEYCSECLLSLHVTLPRRTAPASFPVMWWWAEPTFVKMRRVAPFLVTGAGAVRGKQSPQSQSPQLCVDRCLVTTGHRLCSKKNPELCKKDDDRLNMQTFKKRPVLVRETHTQIGQL